MSNICRSQPEQAVWGWRAGQRTLQRLRLLHRQNKVTGKTLTEFWNAPLRPSRWLTNTRISRCRGRGASCLDRALMAEQGQGPPATLTKTKNLVDGLVDLHWMLLISGCSWYPLCSSIWSYLDLQVRGTITHPSTWWTMSIKHFTVCLGQCWGGRGTTQGRIRNVSP
jgi:hypothetical protein